MFSSLQINYSCENVTLFRQLVKSRPANAQFLGNGLIFPNGVFRVRCTISRSRFPRASFNLVAAGLTFSPPSINPFRKIPFAMPVLRAQFVAAMPRASLSGSASHTLKPLLRKKRRTLVESRGGRSPISSRKQYPPTAIAKAIPLLRSLNT